MRISLILIAFLFLSSLICAQSPHRPMAQAEKVVASFKIDGIDNESGWTNAEIHTDFIESRPNPGEKSSRKTEARILYSDEGIYVFGKMYEHPDSVVVRITPRDNSRNVDWFGIVLDTYNSGINGYAIGVTSAGVQFDRQFSSDGEDSGWNAVWQSKVLLTDYGWATEMFIPFNAVRFAETPSQDWGLNFARNVESIRESSFWSELDPNIDGFINQAGTWKNIQSIQSPLRLSLFPFVAANLDWLHDKSADPKNINQTSFTGGADIKYGLNDAFTLDMTLIPDFSQARSDNAVLNLSPFEVQFNEQRQFFQEGVELFGRADIFFTRRIGDKLVFLNDAYDNLRDDEELVNVPNSARLLNITKLTGRTTKGLGVGVINAISQRTTAQATSDTSSREVLLNPFTNYNVIVFDQNLKNNGFVSLINTNVLRKGSAYEANVTGTEFELRNKANSHSMSGKGSISQIIGVGTLDLGHQFGLNFAKISGKLAYEVSYEEIGGEYDINDLGFQRLRNYREMEAFVQIRQFEPKGLFNNYRFNFGIEYESLRTDWDYANFSLFQNTFGQSKGFNGIGRFTYFEPAGSHDYFEPRTDDFETFLYKPPVLVNGGFFSSNYSKKLAIDLEASHYTVFEKGRSGYDFSIEPRIRLWDKMILRWRWAYGLNRKELGYVSLNSDGKFYSELDQDQVYMSQRDRKILSTILRFDYSLSANLNINFRMRHNWTNVDVKDVFLLGEEGKPEEIAYNGNDFNDNPLHDINFNAFNIDLVATWRFAPGSDLIFVWKDSITESDDRVRKNYFKNVDNLFDQAQLNTFTIKAVYFLDHYTLKKGLTKSS